MLVFFIRIFYTLWVYQTLYFKHIFLFKKIHTLKLEFDFGIFMEIFSRIYLLQVLFHTHKKY